MQNNANEMAVFNTAIYVRLSKEDIVAAQSGRESNSITNQKQLILDFLKDKPEFNIVSISIDDGYTGPPPARRGAPPRRSPFRCRPRQ